MNKESNSQNHCLSIRDLSFSYPDSIFHLKIPELEISRGQHTAIVGPSGSGKTTLLHLIAGILRPQNGKITVLGNSMDQMNDRALRIFRNQNIGFIFQDFKLLNYLSVSKNVTLPYHINAEAKWTKKKKASGLLESVGLEHRANARPNALSQGEKQRIALCRALITSPPLILADEPTGNLDARNKREVLELLFRESNALCATLMMVTHDLSLLPHFDYVFDFNDFTGL